MKKVIVVLSLLFAGGVQAADFCTLVVERSKFGNLSVSEEECSDGYDYKTVLARDTKNFSAAISELSKIKSDAGWELVTYSQVDENTGHTEHIYMTFKK